MEKYDNLQAFYVISDSEYNEQLPYRLPRREIIPSSIIELSLRAPRTRTSLPYCIRGLVYVESVTQRPRTTFTNVSYKANTSIHQREFKVNQNDLAVTVGQRLGEPHEGGYFMAAAIGSDIDDFIHTLSDSTLVTTLVLQYI